MIDGKTRTAKTQGHGKFRVARTTAYLDTVTLLSRQPLPRSIFAEVLRLQGKALIPRTVPVTGRDGLGAGNIFFSTVHQPTCSTLSYLAPMQGQTFTVNSVHIAFDFHVATLHEAEHLQQQFDQRLRQTWHRPQDRGSELGTLYWRRRPNSPRNIAIYSDKPSKPDGSPCCHVELRFTGAAACRRARLSDLRLLAGGIDALALLNRQTKLSQIDFDLLDAVLERAARQFLPKTKRHHRYVKIDSAKVELTVGLLKCKIGQLLARSMGTDGSLNTIRSQDIWDSSHRWLRAALVEGPWQQIMPTPRWHCWRIEHTIFRSFIVND